MRGLRRGDLVRANPSLQILKKKIPTPHPKSLLEPAREGDKCEYQGALEQNFWGKNSKFLGAKSWGFLRAAGFAQGGVGLTTPLLSAEREGPATKPALVPPLLPCKRCCSFCWAAGSTCQGWGESSQIPFSSPCPHKSVQLIFLLSTAVSFPCLCSVEKKLKE